LETVPGRR